MDNEQAISKLVAESLANRLAESGLEQAYLEARCTLALTELQMFHAVLESDQALKELFEETQTKLMEGN